MDNIFQKAIVLLSKIESEEKPFSDVKDLLDLYKVSKDDKKAVLDVFSKYGNKKELLSKSEVFFLKGYLVELGFNESLAEGDLVELKGKLERALKKHLLSSSFESEAGDAAKMAAKTGLSEKDCQVYVKRILSAGEMRSNKQEVVTHGDSLL